MSKTLQLGSEFTLRGWKSMKKKEPSLARSRWWRIIPIVFIVYSFAYMDRTNFGLGIAGGMGDDLNLSPNIISLMGALFFLGYFFLQVPGAHYAEKKSAKKLLFWALIVWGLLSAATGMVSNVNVLMAIRFLLGIAESVVYPSFLVLVSHLFTKRERTRANALLTIGSPLTVTYMSIVSGYLISGHGWRGMFIIEGIIPALFAIVWWFTIVDKPQEAKW